LLEDTPISLDREPLVDFYDSTIEFVGAGDAAGYDFPELARNFPVSTDPIPLPNILNVNGTGLRGALQINALNPDYSLAANLMAGLGYSAISFNAPTINLSVVNPRLSVGVTGTAPLPPGDFPGIGSELVATYPIPTVDIGIANWRTSRAM